MNKSSLILIPADPLVSKFHLGNVRALFVPCVSLQDNFLILKDIQAIVALPPQTEILWELVLGV